MDSAGDWLIRDGRPGSLHPADVFAGTGIDLDHFVLVDEQRHPHHRTGLEFGGLLAAGGGVWPPTGVELFDPFHLPLFNTLLLLTSGTTVTWAHHALLNNDRQGLKWGLALTVVLGVLFSFVQVLEYTQAGFSYSGNLYGATFFMATGFHGFHVLIGTIFLIVCLVRANLGHFTPQQHLGFEFAAWYWHFVDVVWLFLFASIYVWGSWGVAVGH